MPKAHALTEMSKGQSDNTNNATKKFVYTAIVDWLRTVSWSNYSHPTGVVNCFTGPTFPLTATAVYIEGKGMEILLYSDINIKRDFY